MEYDFTVLDAFLSPLPAGSNGVKRKEQRFHPFPPRSAILQFQFQMMRFDDVVQTIYVSLSDLRHH